MALHSIPTNGVEICVDTIGEPTDPAVLLIAGAACSMDWWDEVLCARIADGGRRVIRYDLRDTGQSTTSPAGAPDYAFSDLVTDAAGVLEGSELASAHVVGLSMGGAIAQQLAATRPELVDSLTLICTAPGGPVDEKLPASAPGLFDDEPPAPDWSDRDAVIEHMVAGERAFESERDYEPDMFRTFAGRVFDRTRDIEATLANHWILEGGDAADVALGELDVPTLVVQATADPMFPPPTGRIMAEAIPDARLLELDGVGHQFPPPRMWDLFVRELLAHSARP